MALAHFSHLLTKFLFKGLKSRIILYNGEEAITNQPFRLLYVGSNTDLCIITYRFYGSHPFEEKDLGECWFFQVKQRLAGLAQQADLVLVSRNCFSKWAPRKGRWMVVPSQLRMVMDFTPGQEWSSIEKVMKKRQSYNIHKMRNNGYHLETSTDPKDLDFFISQMYLPYIGHRYKDQGQVASRWYLKELFPHAELKFAVCPDGKRVAGLYCYRQGRVAHWMYLAALNGNEYWTQQGALAAVYYLGIQEAFENGLRRVDVGEVRPFQDEKLYTHKKHWGFKPVLHPWNYCDWLFWAPDESSFAAEWLDVHPPISGFAHHSKTSSEISAVLSLKRG